jgi:hypothetical protein
MEKYDINEGNEALKRALLMMNYDTKKTLTENVEEIQEQNWTQTTTADSFKTPKPKSLYGNNYTQTTTADSLASAGETTGAEIAGAETVGAEIAGAETAGVLTTAGLGAAALAAAPWIAGAAVVGGLGYWLYDSINNGLPTADKVKSFFNSCSTKNKGLKITVPESTIISAAEKINKAIEGLGTDEEAIKSAIESMPTVADLCMLKTKYDYRYGDLYEDLDGDIDGTDWKTYVWSPMASIIERANQDIKKVKNNTGGGKSNSKFKFCKGTYKQGCKSSVIAKIQKCLNVKTDGLFGPKTQGALESRGFSGGFTDNDVTKICGNGGTSQPTPNPTTPNPTTPNPTTPNSQPTPQHSPEDMIDNSKDILTNDNGL